MSYLCSTCQVGLRPLTNGVTVLETAHTPTKLYKVWQADEWICQECGAKVILGFSQTAKHVFAHDAPTAQFVLRLLGNPSKLRVWLERPLEGIDAMQLIRDWLAVPLDE